MGELSLEAPVVEARDKRDEYNEIVNTLNDIDYFRAGILTHVIDRVTSKCSIERPPRSHSTNHMADLVKYYDYFICLENLFYDDSSIVWSSTVKSMVQEYQLSKGKDVSNLWYAIDNCRKIYQGPGGMDDELQLKFERVEEIEQLGTIMYKGNDIRPHAFLTHFAYDYFKRERLEKQRAELAMKETFGSIGNFLTLNMLSGVQGGGKY